MSIGLASILLVGLGASFPNPGTFVQVNFAAGPTSGGPAAQNVLIIGNKTSAGTATADTAVYGPDTSTPVQGEADVITLFGVGSQLHRAWRKFNRVNKTTPVYFIAAAESAGAQATGVFLVTTSGTVTAGNVRIFYADEFVDVTVNAADTATAIGGNIATAINNNVNWGITAVNTNGSVAVTAKNHGPEGNWIRLQVIPGPGFAPANLTVTDYGTTWATLTPYATGAFIQPATANGFYYKATTGGTSAASPPTFPTTLGTTVSDGSVTWTCWGTLSTAGIATLGGGATADNYTTALATVAQQRYRYYLLCDSDATNVGRAATQVTAMAQPLTGIRQSIVYGSSDTSGNAITLATGLNSPQAEMVWGGGATDLTPLELAANALGIYMLFEATGATGYRLVGRLNFSLFPTANTSFNDSASWFVQPTRNGPNAGPSVTAVTSLLQNGVTPIAFAPGGSGAVQLVKRITTKSTTGSNQDWRIRDAHKVSIMFAVADGMAQLTNQQFAAKDLIDPPKTGQSPVGGVQPNGFATNVLLWGNALKDYVSKVEGAGLLQNADATNAAAIVQREVNPRDRMSASFDLQTADVADQFAIVASQVG